ncbi:hypothetical protein SAMN05216299_1358 [Nitrosospira sp. Nsp14]|uniref:hypothetical protein n=1 Tax=Nitrosospira sp. Nsp14 TaxID=1855333 RepID=UPI0008ED4F66|nr:hypothetical protein [Nitrosospira sp. Nsp14]SFH61287.1 hypothetical protein SAMN05216299_1358 [Nitrosospira sp. Nsp14]
MFEAITFSRQNKYDTINPLDIGWLVECMLFYQKVTVVANESTLRQLITYFGSDKLLILINEEVLTILFTESLAAIHTTSQNTFQYHDIALMTLHSPTYQDKLRTMCIDITGKSGKGRRLAQKIEANIHVTKHDPIVVEGARKAILDVNYIEPAARLIIKELVPEVGDTSKLLFATELGSNGIEVYTNVDFGKINQVYHQRVPVEHSSITPALILSHILETETELYFASSQLSELAASGLSSKLGEQKIDYLISKSKSSSEKLTNFTGFVFNDAKALREAVNSNRINVDDLVALLIKSKRFKEWLVGIAPDKDLIKQYHEEVTRKTFIDGLPGKALRWGIFVGVGLGVNTAFGPLAGIAISALNTFYLDKLIRGWKPNQFIEGDVKKMIYKRAA